MGFWASKQTVVGHALRRVVIATLYGRTPKPLIMLACLAMFLTALFGCIHTERLAIAFLQGLWTEANLSSGDGVFALFSFWVIVATGVVGILRGIWAGSVWVGDATRRCSQEEAQQVLKWLAEAGHRGQAGHRQVMGWEYDLVNATLAPKARSALRSVTLEQSLPNAVALPKKERF